MRKNILLSVSSALALAFAGAAFVACGGDDTGTPPPADGGKEAGPDSTTGDTGVPDSTAAKTSSDTGAETGTSEAGEGGGGGGDAGDAGDGGAVSEAGDAGDGGSAADADAGPPPPPVLGPQIDRFGRPAVNTALNHAFDSNATTAGAAKDTYNADRDAGGWVSAYSPEIQKNLGILDSLDTTDAGGGCGNQPFAANDAGAARYATLGGVLADDRLWINTAATTCSKFLGVELIATGVIPADGGVDGGPTNECGGRTLSYDVIQTEYSVFSGVGLTGFGSGVSAVAAKTSGTTFPYLAPPQ